MAGKCHIWLWPFESTMEEIAQIWNDLKHLYDHKKRTLWVVTPISGRTFRLHWRHRSPIRTT